MLESITYVINTRQKIGWNKNSIILLLLTIL